MTIADLGRLVDGEDTALDDSACEIALSGALGGPRLGDRMRIEGATIESATAAGVAFGICLAVQSGMDRGDVLALAREIQAGAASPHR